MQMGPSALDPYKTEQGALDFFADDNIDKSPFSLLALLGVASHNAVLGRSLLDLQRSSPGVFYLSASRLAALAENEEIAIEILDDGKLQDILLMKTGRKNAAGEIEKDVKYLMQVASRHQSVKERVLKHPDFLKNLNASQLVESAKAIKEIAEKVEREPALSEKLSLNDWINIASAHEVMAQRLLNARQDLNGDQLVKLSKASQAIKNDILNERRFSSKLTSIDNWIEIAEGNDRLAQQVFNNWRNDFTPEQLVRLSRISQTVKKIVLSNLADRLNGNHYVEIARGDEQLSQEILNRWGDRLDSSHLDRLADNPIVAARIVDNPDYVNKLQEYYYQQTQLNPNGVWDPNLDNKSIGFSQKIELGRGVLYEKMQGEAKRLRASQEEETQKPLSVVLEELNSLLSHEKPSTSVEEPLQANRLDAWQTFSAHQPRNFLQTGEDEDEEQEVQFVEEVRTATATRSSPALFSQGGWLFCPFFARIFPILRQAWG